MIYHLIKFEKKSFFPEGFVLDSPLGFFNKVPIKANFSLLSAGGGFFREKKQLLRKQKNKENLLQSQLLKKGSLLFSFLKNSSVPNKGAKKVSFLLFFF